LTIFILIWGTRQQKCYGRGGAKIRDSGLGKPVAAGGVSQSMRYKNLINTTLRTRSQLFENKKISISFAQPKKNKVGCRNS